MMNEGLLNGPNFRHASFGTHEFFFWHPLSLWTLVARLEPCVAWNRCPPLVN